MKEWEAKVLEAPGAAERVAEMEDEFPLAARRRPSERVSRPLCRPFWPSRSPGSHRGATTADPGYDEVARVTKRVTKARAPTTLSANRTAPLSMWKMLFHHGPCIPRSNRKRMAPRRSEWVGVCSSHVRKDPRALPNSQWRPKITETAWPPKPNEFDITTSTLASRAWFGTTSRSQSGSGFS